MPYLLNVVRSGRWLCVIALGFRTRKAAAHQTQGGGVYQQSALVWLLRVP
jgi:hypothetical protein